MTAAAYIPARGSSVRLTGKNLRPIGGVPMVRLALDVALEAQRAGLVDRVVLDTDDDMIASHGDRTGAEVWMRSEHLRGADIRVIDLLRAWLRPCEPVDLVAVLMVTSPLRTLKHLAESRAALRDDVDGVLSLTRFSQDPSYAVHATPTDSGDVCQLHAHHRVPKALEAPRIAGKHDGTIAWYRRDALLKLPLRENVYALRLAPYWVPAMESVDVDTEKDCVIAEALLRARA